MSANQFGKNKLAVFDIDGTIFRYALQFELFKGLVEYGIFPRIVLKETEEHYGDWLNRRGRYRDFEESLIMSFQNRIRGKVVEDIQKVSRYIVEVKKEHLYVYTRNLIQQLRKDHILLAISGAPQEVVDEFATYWKFDKAYGTGFARDNGVYTGAISFPAFSIKKDILQQFCNEHNVSLQHSIGVGDTVGDIPFLEEVEQPIAFNPSRELYDVARERGWKIVVERKDMVYEL